LFAQLVDDPSSLPDQFPTAELQMPNASARFMYWIWSREQPGLRGSEQDALPAFSRSSRM
jgi:hypothetical protein